MWHGIQLGSGLDVELIYDRHVRVNGEVVGLQDDYHFTSSLARFLALNQSLISDKLSHLEVTIDAYREHHRRECQMKADVLSYRFLSFVYNQPRDPTGLAESSIVSERDLRVRQLMVGSEAIFEITYKRLAAVTTTEAATWWYIFWVRLISHVLNFEFLLTRPSRMIYGGETMMQLVVSSFMLRTSIHTFRHLLPTVLFQELRWRRF